MLLCKHGRPLTKEWQRENMDRIQAHAETYRRLFERLAQKSDGDEVLDAINVKDGAIRLLEMIERTKREDVTHADYMAVADALSESIERYEQKHCREVTT